MTELARKVTGLSQQALEALEKRDSASSQFSAALADALDVNLRWLLTGKGRMDEPEWPFVRVDRARWDACDDTDRGYIQAALNKSLDECEKMRLGCPAPSGARPAQPEPEPERSRVERASVSRRH